MNSINKQFSPIKQWSDRHLFGEMNLVGELMVLSIEVDKYSSVLS